MQDSYILRTARYAPALFFLAAFGLMMIAFDDLDTTWRKIAAGVLCLAVLAGVAAALYDSAAYLADEWGKSDKANPFVRLALLLVANAVYAALCWALVLMLNRLVVIWPPGNPAAPAVPATQESSPAGAPAGTGPLPDTPRS